MWQARKCRTMQFILTVKNDLKNAQLNKKTRTHSKNTLKNIRTHHFKSIINIVWWWNDPTLKLASYDMQLATWLRLWWPENMGKFRSSYGVPQNGWSVRENPTRQKWMMTGGYPYDSGNLHMVLQTACSALFLQLQCTGFGCLLFVFVSMKGVQ